MGKRVRPAVERHASDFSLMRALVAASMGGIGHLTPVLTAAEECRALGHEVTMLVPPAISSQARRSGLPVVVGDEPPRAFIDDFWERLRAERPDPGLIDRELFADRATEAMLDAARAVRDSFHPHLVVREPRRRPEPEPLGAEATPRFIMERRSHFRMTSRSTATPVRRARPGARPADPGDRSYAMATSDTTADDRRAGAGRAGAAAHR